MPCNIKTFQTGQYLQHNTTHELGQISVHFYVMFFPLISIYLVFISFFLESQQGLMIKNVKKDGKK